MGLIELIEPSRTFSSGFQLGELNMLMDKRHVYDWDTRVHLLARGPGIPRGVSIASPATQVGPRASCRVTPRSSAVIARHVLGPPRLIDSPRRC